MKKKIKIYFVHLFSLLKKFFHRLRKLTQIKHFKFIIPLLSFCLLLLLVLASRFIPEMLASSVYNINDLNDNISNLKAGDIINYDINGYSNWRVLNVDKENGTVEVTSNSNVYDLTMEPYKSVDDYRNILQNEANKFYDNKYVINSRTIAKSDSLTFDTTGEYWLANVNENTLMTNKIGSQETATILFKEPIDTDNVYVVPFIRINVYSDDRYNYSEGDLYNYLVNGINEWIVLGNFYGDPFSHSFSLMSKTPIKVNSDSNSTEDVYTRGLRIINSFKTGAVLEVGNGPDYYNFKTKYYSLLNSDVFNETDEIYILKYDTNENDSNCIEKKYFYECKSSILKLASNGSYNNLNSINLPKVLTFGYRPVLTLRFGSKSIGKDNSDILNVGDNVKYEANGYKNWKVLSINKTAGTVDVISGGIVKNLSLFGKEDFDNYEFILQRKVDAYRKGDNVVGARAIMESDVDLLSNMKDTVAAMYWYNKKFEGKRILTSNNFQTSSTSLDNKLSYGVGVLWTNTGDYYINDIFGSSSNSNIRKYWVRLYSKDDNNSEYYLGTGKLNYIAGIRPIITLKYDSVKALSVDESKKLDEISQNYDKYYMSEQQLNNSTEDASTLLNSDDGEDNVENTEVDNSDKTDYRVISANLGETNNILKLAVILSIIYGFIVVGLILFIYFYNLKKRSS